MSQNAINPLNQTYVNTQSVKKTNHEQNCPKNYLNENCLDSVELSKKQSGIKSFGKGILYTIAQAVPLLGRYLIGDMACNQQDAAEIVKDLKDGDIDNKTTEKGACSKLLKGICSSLLLVIPFLGTYLTGKNKYERENLNQDIADIKAGKQIQTHNKKGVLKTYFKGLWERIKVSIPFYGQYYLGKEAANMKNLSTDAKNISNALSPGSAEE